MTMATFQTSKQGIQDSGGAPRLNYPYIGPARLINVENQTIEGKDGTEYPNVLTFTFELGGTDILDNNVRGQVVEKLEWAPREDDDAQKTQNKIDRIGYIAKYWLGEDKAAAISGNSWEEFINNVVDEFKKLDDYTKKVITLKVTGQVYNGTPSVNIPNYRGFISDDDSASQVTFSKKEIQDNNRYVAEMKSSPTESGDLVEDAGEAKNPFDDQPGF